MPGLRSAGACERLISWGEGKGSVCVGRPPLLRICEPSYPVRAWVLSSASSGLELGDKVIRNGGRGEVWMDIYGNISFFNRTSLSILLKVSAPPPHTYQNRQGSMSTVPSTWEVETGESVQDQPGVAHEVL